MGQDEESDDDERTDVEGHQAVALVWLTSVLPASAQADGRFAGTVQDASGAFLPNATITVKNEKTGEERSTTTSAQGVYVVTSLKPSTYTIRAVSGNFCRWSTRVCSWSQVRNFISTWS